MANIKSAKKRVITSQKRAAANKSVKTGVKNVVKNVNTAIDSGDKAAAEAALRAAESTIDKAEHKGVIPQNTASRKVSRLATRISKMQ